MSEPVAPDLPSQPSIVDELRRLRAENGNPTLQALAQRSGVSKSVLSEAFAGKKVPSERTLLAIAHAFGVDGTELVRQRRALEPQPLSPEEGKGRRRFGSGVLALVAVAGLVVGALAGGFGGWGIGHSASGHLKTASAAVVADAPQIVVKNGTDPADTKCVNDAKVVASQTEAHDTQLQIIYSSACHAAWSRINRYDGQATGNEVSTSIYRQIAPNAKDRQSTTEPDAQSAYTTLIVRPSSATELCAVGSITLNGQTIDLGKPICL